MEHLRLAGGLGRLEPTVSWAAQTRSFPNRSLVCVAPRRWISCRLRDSQVGSEKVDQQRGRPRIPPEQGPESRAAIFDFRCSVATAFSIGKSTSGSVVLAIHPSKNFSRIEGAKCSAAPAMAPTTAGSCSVSSESMSVVSNRSTPPRFRSVVISTISIDRLSIRSRTASLAERTAISCFRRPTQHERSTSRCVRSRAAQRS